MGVDLMEAEVLGNVNLHNKFAHEPYIDQQKLELDVEEFRGKIWKPSICNVRGS
jgi:hypothetical protein